MYAEPEPGMKTRYHTFQVNVTTTAALLLYYNKDRTVYSIIAIAGDVYIGPDPTVTTSSGYLMRQYIPQTFKLQDGEDTRMPVYAISASGTGIMVSVREDMQEERTETYKGVR